jgi:DNA-binding response OmpR family regulator
MTRILVVEDEASIAFGLKMDLETEGYAVVTESNGDAALNAAKEGNFDLILLDVMLPGKDGFEVCRALRRAEVTSAIILLTAKAQEAEKILGLELGADDYVTKPFSPRELRARIKAVLRRGAGGTKPEVVRFGDVEVDFTRGEVRRAGKPLDLSALEFKLLSAFVKNRGRVLSREQLLNLTWGHNVAVSDRVVDNHVVTLRKAIEPEAGSPKYLVSVRGMGYRFEG